MKKIIAFLFATILIGSCKDSKTNVIDICRIPDTRVIGSWKLVKKCLCYNYGGDWVWWNFKDTITFSLNSQCLAVQSGNTYSSCNEGKYFIKNDTIRVVFNCPSGTKVPDTFLYSFDPKNDTLTLKEFNDDGYFGFKYIKKTDNVN